MGVFFFFRMSENSFISYLKDTYWPLKYPSPPPMRHSSYDGEAGGFLLSGPEGLTSAIIWKLMVKVCYSCQEPLPET